MCSETQVTGEFSEGKVWSDWKLEYLVKQKHKQGSIKTFSDVVATTLNCEELKEVSKLVDICDTVKEASVLMNHIKTKSRNHPEVTRVKSKQEGDVDKVYNRWRSEDRQENEVIFYSLSSDSIDSYCLTH